MKKDKAFDPLDVGLLGAVGVVLEPKRISDLIQQFGWGGFHGSLALAMDLDNHTTGI